MTRLTLTATPTAHPPLQVHPSASPPRDRTKRKCSPYGIPPTHTSSKTDPPTHVLILAFILLFLFFSKNHFLGSLCFPPPRAQRSGSNAPKPKRSRTNHTRALEKIFFYEPFFSFSPPPFRAHLVSNRSIIFARPRPFGKANRLEQKSALSQSSSGDGATGSEGRVAVNAWTDLDHRARIHDTFTLGCFVWRLSVTGNASKRSRRT